MCFVLTVSTSGSNRSSTPPTEERERETRATCHKQCTTTGETRNAVSGRLRLRLLLWLPLLLCRLSLTIFDELLQCASLSDGCFWLRRAEMLLVR